MKIFANKYIKQFFISILICAAVYAAAALSIVFSGLDNAAVWVFLLSALMAVGILAVSLNYFIKQNRSIEQAALQVRNYLSGDRTARIDCMREGELYRLFHEVNNLVAALNAHAENELRAKEFLKDTISDISHQLKTPVAALNIYNGLIQAEGEDLPEIKNLAELSEKELDRIEVLIQNLLKITRFDAEAIVLNRSMENVAEMMNRVREQFAFRARSGHAVVRPRLDLGGGLQYRKKRSRPYGAGRADRYYVEGVRVRRSGRYKGRRRRDPSRGYMPHIQKVLPEQVLSGRSGDRPRPAARQNDRRSE